MGTDATGLAPAASDFLSLSFRMRSLLTLRVGFTVVALVAGILTTGDHVGPGLTVSALTYLASETVIEVIRRRGRGRRLVLLAVGVLLDGLFLTWITYLTGGVLSPLQVLIYVHVIAISLLASYRTGLKVAVWDTLLLSVVANAVAAGQLPEPTALLAGGSAGVPTRGWVITIFALWGIAIATAVLSAVNERDLRRKRADLTALTQAVAQMAACDTPEDVPNILLEALAGTFGVARSVVFASPAGDLAMLASRGVREVAAADGMDDVVERALNTRRVQLVRQLDPERDPRLRALMPDAHNVVILPLSLAGGFRLGVLVVENPEKGERIEGWTVEVMRQFASHTAVRLHNLWLLEEDRRKLAEIRRLRDRLMAVNLTLESRVIDRTAQLQGSDHERQRLLTQLVSAQEDERRRIAGDIHDDPLQLLVAVTMRLEALKRDLPELAQAEQVAELREWIRAAVGKLRNLMFELRPPILDEDGLAAAIEEYAEHWNLEQSVSVEDRFTQEPPDEQRLILYRIAQEAFANIRKHSMATRVSVTLEQRDRDFVVRIIDDGIGFGSGTVVGVTDGHIGLTTMRERAELAGGGCRIHSLPGDGTTVEFWVPLSLQTVRRHEPTDAGSEGDDGWAPARGETDGSPGLLLQ
jgi:signal transduction histidine kinase